MNIKRSWNLLNIYDLIIIALLVLTVYNIQKFPHSVLPIVTITAAAVLLDSAIDYAKNRKMIFPKSALITGLILGVIVDGSLLFLIAVAAIAILSKHVIRIHRRHIFNPANFGLFIAILFSQFLPISQSWWGASNLLLVVVLGLVIVWKLKRYHLVLPFLAAHAVLMFIIFSFSASQLTAHLASGSLLFFTFYMLIEPVTSPVRMKSRIAFGALAGLFAAVLYLVWLPAMLIGALFFADLFVPILNWKPKIKPTDIPPTNPNW